MPIVIKRTGDVKANGIKCVVYGEAGSGKTMLCSTAPNPIIISAEGGLLSLADLDLPYIEINTLRDLEMAYKDLKSGSEYDTICVDSLSEVTEKVIAEIVQNYKDPRQAYGELATTMMVLIRKFRDIKGKHVVFTTKLENVRDDEGTVVGQCPILPGRVLSTQLPYMVDELFCAIVDRKGRHLQTKSDRLRQCKDRSGKLDPKEEMNLSAIFNKILA